MEAKMSLQGEEICASVPAELAAGAIAAKQRGQNGAQQKDIDAQSRGALRGELALKCVHDGGWDGMRGLGRPVR